MQKSIQCLKKDDSRKKIIFVVWDANVSGGVRAVFEVANDLKDRGHDVKIIALQGNHRWFTLRVPIEYVKPRFTFLRNGRLQTKIFYGLVAAMLIIFVKISTKGHLSFLGKTANSFGCEMDWGKALADAIPPCDISVATWFPTALSVWTAGKGKLFYFMQDFPEQTKSLSQRQMLEMTYRLPLYFLTDSDFLRELVLERQTRAKVRTVGSGIRTETFFPRGSRKNNTVMAILSNAPNKGAETIIQALNEVNVSSPIHAFFVGPDTVTKRVEPLFPFTFFEIPGTAPQHDQFLAELYSSAEILVYSSTVEGFGLPPLEAMSCGTLVVTTDCKGNRDYAVNEHNCLVVPPNNHRAMANAILRVLKESSLKEKIRDGGLATAKMWTWKRVVDNFEDAFKENY